MDIKYKTYNDGYYSGIKFETDTAIYDLNHDIERDWDRIYIENKTGGWFDIPFRPEVLPKSIIVRKYEYR